MSMMWVGIGSAVASVAGGVISANGAKKAQQGANAAAATAADKKSQFDWDAYLLTRGVINDGSPPGVMPTNPKYVNTSLPLGSTIDGLPSEQVLFNRALTLSKTPKELASDPSAYASADNISSFLSANPQVRTDLEKYLKDGGDTRTVEKWLSDDATQDATGNFSQQLQSFAASAIQAQRAATTPTVAPGITALQPLSTGLATNLLDGSLLRDRLAALQPALDARTAAANLQTARNTEMRTGSTNILNSQLTGLTDVKGVRETAANDTYTAQIDSLAKLLGVRQDQAKAIFDANVAGSKGILGSEVTGAGNIQTASENAAKSAYDANIDGLANLLGVRRDQAQAIYDANVAGSKSVLSTDLAGVAGIQGASETAAQGSYDANIAKLADVLGVRTDAAKAIYDASTKGNQDIYGAQLLSADVYGQSAEQAANRAIASQNANRARQGFSGTSSGADLLKARTLYGALQQGASARTAAGETLARGNANAGVGLATTQGQAQEQDALQKLQAALQLAQSMGLAKVTGATGTATANSADANRVSSAGTNLATTQGQASEQDALQKLLAAVNLAQQQGAARVTGATSVANATTNDATRQAAAGTGLATTQGAAAEQDALQQLQAALALYQQLGTARTDAATGAATAKTNDATRQATILDSDAGIAKENATFQNAMDKLNAILGGQQQQLAGINLPYELGGADLSLKTQETNAKYSELDALIKRLMAFSTPNNPSSLTTAPVGSVINSGQVAGSALTSLATNQSLLSALGKLGGGSSVDTTNFTTLANTNPNSLKLQSFATA